MPQGLCGRRSTEAKLDWGFLGLPVMRLNWGGMRLHSPNSGSECSEFSSKCEQVIHKLSMSKLPVEFVSGFFCDKLGKLKVFELS